MKTNELTLTFIPSPLGIDWSSPKKLAQTAALNKLSLKPRFIGHVFVELKGWIENSPHYELTGMSSSNMDTINQVIFQKKGFGVLFHSFPGKLEKKEELEKELSRYYPEGRVSFLTYQVSDSTYKRLVYYFEEFKRREGYRYYGGPHRPRHLEGSGCSAFGMSFLQVAGLYQEPMQQWWSQFIRIPLPLAGAPITDQKVSLFNIIRQAHSWAQESEEHIPFFIWDPDSMHRWVLNKIQQKQGEGNFEIANRQKSQGIIYNQTHLPTPTEDLFIEEQSEYFKRSLLYL